MIPLNSRVRIVSSDPLIKLRLSAMADYTGIIVEDLTEARKNKGYMVMLDEQFLDERLWFVPLKSVRHEK